MTLNPTHVEWTRNTLGMVKIGGVWSIPRSGTLVHRTGEHSVLIDGPEEINDELLSYIRAAGFTIENDLAEDKPAAT
jgi:hypothetical protein